jgi:hypothetical protein
MIVETYMATAAMARTTTNTIFFFLGVIERKKISLGLQVANPGPIGKFLAAMRQAPIYHSAQWHATAEKLAALGAVKYRRHSECEL